MSKILPRHKAQNPTTCFIRHTFNFIFASFPQILAVSSILRGVLQKRKRKKETKTKNTNHHHGRKCYVEYEEHNKNFPFGDWDRYPSERNTHRNRSSRWRGWGDTSLSSLPLGFCLSLEFFYFDSCCHHQVMSPSLRAGEGEEKREVLSLFFFLLSLR